ncbi:hypothetical protein BGZ49_006914 [Haplosporangium sp. Z 27]|nr:hypothetical protein BGZ49_006914 [Haplosporangium sp. Z 27]
MVLTLEAVNQVSVHAFPATTAEYSRHSDFTAASSPSSPSNPSVPDVPASYLYPTSGYSYPSTPQALGQGYSPLPQPPIDLTLQQSKQTHKRATTSKRATNATNGGSLVCYYDPVTTGVIHCSNGLSYQTSFGSTLQVSSQTPNFNNGLANSQGYPSVSSSSSIYSNGNPSYSTSLSGNGEVKKRSNSQSSGYPTTTSSSAPSSYSEPYLGASSGYSSSYTPNYNPGYDYGKKGYTSSRGYNAPGNSLGGPSTTKRSVHLGPVGGGGESSSTPNVVPVPININTLVYPDGEMTLMPPEDTSAIDGPGALGGLHSPANFN